MRAEIRVIFNDNFNVEEKKLLYIFAKIIKRERENKDLHRKIWEYDQSLTGLGGYATPLNPMVNPFNSWGDYRNVFRSLQYARCDMFICTRPRHTIVDTALHLECLIKLLVSKNKILKFIHNRRELGKNIEQLYKENIINEDLYEKLFDLKKILNLAKHDTDPNRDMTFDYEDAIIFYFASRKIGNQLLEKIGYHTYGGTYEINEETI